MDEICPKSVFPVENEKSEQHHWITHIRIRQGAMFLGATALLGQSKEGWPPTAPLDHVENSQTKILLDQVKKSWPSLAPPGCVDLTKMQKPLESKNSNNNKNERQNENKNKNSFLFSSLFLFSFCFLLVYLVEQ